MAAQGIEEKKAAAGKQREWNGIRAASCRARAEIDALGKERSWTVSKGSSVCFDVAEAGSINSDLSFLTLAIVRPQEVNGRTFGIRFEPAVVRESIICNNLPCFLGHGNTFGSESDTQPAHRVL